MEIKTIVRPKEGKYTFFKILSKKACINACGNSNVRLLRCPAVMRRNAQGNTRREKPNKLADSCTYIGSDNVYLSVLICSRS